jgi:hypothetical protein
MTTFKRKANEDLPENLRENGLVSAILRLQVARPENWDWKEDYATALEEKNENLYRR